MAARQTSDKPLGLCVVGLGIGRRYLDLAKQRAGVRIASVCARHEARVAEAQHVFDAPFGSVDYHAAIDLPDVDAVVIASPDRQHFEQAAFALRCGKHVLCEKPMATTVDDARRLVELAGQSDRTFMPGHNYRFIPQFAALHDLLSRGEVGDVYLAEGAYVQDMWVLGTRGADYWRVTDPQDMFLGAGVHIVDLLMWCLDPVAEVYAYANNRLLFYPGTENYVAALQFEGGAIGHVTVALASRRQNRFRVSFTFHGAGGEATADNQHAAVVLDRAEPVMPSTLAVEKGNPLGAELDHFLACIHTGQVPLVTATDGARAVAIAAAANRSVAERRPVKPEPVIGHTDKGRRMMSDDRRH